MANQDKLNEMTDLERAIEVGRTTAEENLKAERKENGDAVQADQTSRDEAIEIGQKTAVDNYKNVDQKENADFDGTAQIPKNNTTDEAKKATAKSQLDPTGKDGISKSEVDKSATDASMETGNKNNAAKHAGTHEENTKAAIENPFSTAGKGVTVDLKSKEVQDTGHKSTSNTNPEKASKS